MKLYFCFLIAFALTMSMMSCSKEQTPVITVECKDTVSFKSSILPLIENNCTSCHNTGTLPVISNYAEIVANADQILNSMNGIGNGGVMPQGADPIHPDTIQKFSCWIKQGKLNN